MAELHLYPAGPQVGVAQLVPRAVHIQDDALVVRLDQPAGELPLPRGHRDQPADVAPPVARLGQRPVDAGRTDLEDVLPLAELAAGLLGRVQRGGDLPGQVGDRVQAHPVVAVHHDPQYVPATGPRHGQLLQVVPGGLDDWRDHLAQPALVRGQVGSAGRAGPGRTGRRPASRARRPSGGAIPTDHRAPPIFSCFLPVPRHVGGHTPTRRPWSPRAAAAQSVTRRNPPWGQRRSEGGTECGSSPGASGRGQAEGASGSGAGSSGLRSVATREDGADSAAKRADGAARYHALAGMVFTYAGADGAGTITPGGARRARRYRRRRRARRLLAELRQAEAAPVPTPADLGAGRHPGARPQVPGDHRRVPGPRRAAAAAARRPSSAPRRATQGDGPAGAVGLPLDPGGQRCRRSGRRGRGAEGRRAVRPDRGGDRPPGGIRAVRPAARLDPGLPGGPPGSAVRMSAATDALAAALAAEHAAIFGYGVVGARLTGAATGQAREAESAHRARRDKLVVQLTKAGTTPPAAPPAYALPLAVGDAAGAQKLAVQLEERTAAIWRTALGPTTGGDRELAPGALVDCAQRAARPRGATRPEARAGAPPHSGPPRGAPRPHPPPPRAPH